MSLNQSYYLSLSFFFLLIYFAVDHGEDVHMENFGANLEMVE